MRIVIHYDESVPDSERPIKVEILDSVEHPSTIVEPTGLILAYQDKEHFAGLLFGTPSRVRESMFRLLRKFGNRLAQTIGDALLAFGMATGQIGPEELAIAAEQAGLERAESPLRMKAPKVVGLDAGYL